MEGRWQRVEFPSPRDIVRGPLEIVNVPGAGKSSTTPPASLEGDQQYRRCLMQNC
jgi:hypothetical protein